MHLRDVVTATTTLIAIYAAILSTLNFLRDRRKVKVSFRRETEYFEHDGIGGAGETVTVVTVANAGRRPVTITSLRALRLFPGGTLELKCSPEVPAELREGQRLESWADDEHVDLDETEAFEAEDAVGNSYRKNVARCLARLWSHRRIERERLKRDHKIRRLFKP